jgi:ABC-type branched-subunit amino acid transport system substrate-binding protein
MESMRIKRTLATLLVGVLCAAAVAACGSSSSSTSTSASGSAGGTATNAAAPSSSGGDKSPINIALITFKIPALDFIEDYQAGAQAALNYIKSIGGWGGRDATLQVCNSMLAPAPSTTCAHQMLAKKVVAEFGCETSWGATGLQIFSAAGIPSFNCTNGGQDFTNPLSFGMGTGAPGEAGAMAKWLCKTQPDVKTVAYLTPVDPEQEATVPPVVTPILKSCGKTISYTYIPQTQVDMTPIITKVLSTHPQWVMTTIGQVQMVQVAKSLQQQGFPAGHLSLASNALDMKNVFKPAGSALNDVYASDEWTGWGLDTSDADTYRKWTSSLPNPLSGNVVQGWMYMMWLYTAAKHIGFGNFSSSTLTHWLQTSANGTAIPMSRTYISPGPSGKPAIHQPYVQILHWQNGKMTIVTQGTDNGWITPYDL